MLLVALLRSDQEPSDVDFASAAALHYPAAGGVDPGSPYVAATFDYDTFPDTFVLGDNSVIDGYHNHRLKEGTRYAYALRSLSATNVSVCNVISFLNLTVPVL